jgi:hypothetical protein
MMAAASGVVPGISIPVVVTVIFLARRNTDVVARTRELIPRMFVKSPGKRV